MKQMNSGRLSEAIALQIAQLILSGEIESETKLRQEELASTLAVSRIPIREALQILEAQGLVQRLATRHVVSANLEDAQIREIYGMIAAIEQQAVAELRAGEDGFLPDQAGADNMACHCRIVEKTRNLYVKTLLKNAVNFYVAYAESLPEEQPVASMQAILQCDNWETQGGALLQAHYEELAQRVLTERKRRTHK